MIDKTINKQKQEEEKPRESNKPIFRAKEGKMEIACWINDKKVQEGHSMKIPSFTLQKSWPKADGSGYDRAHINCTERDLWNISLLIPEVLKQANQSRREIRE